MHTNLVPLKRLIGTWRGEGIASYPTMNSDVPYAEETVFADLGKPFLSYSQQTWSLEGGLMHVETGYLRCDGDGRIEFIVALPTGQSELALGEYSSHNDDLFLSTDAEVRCSPTAKAVDRIVRSYAVRGDSLSCDLAMAGVNVGLTLHLRAHLTRS